MSTEEPSQPGLVRMPVDERVQVGGVELGSGMMLNLEPDDFEYPEDWTQIGPIVLEITRVGQLLKSDSFVLIEGFQHVGSGNGPMTRARVIAVKISALKRALTDPSG